MNTSSYSFHSNCVYVLIACQLFYLRWPYFKSILSLPALQCLRVFDTAVHFMLVHWMSWEREKCRERIHRYFFISLERAALWHYSSHDPVLWFTPELALHVVTEEIPEEHDVPSRCFGGDRRKWPRWTSPGLWVQPPYQLISINVNFNEYTSHCKQINSEV